MLGFSIYCDFLLQKKLLWATTGRPMGCLKGNGSFVKLLETN